MRVTNPNATSLRLLGMSYKVYLNEFMVVAGAANQLPVVPAYGEAEYTVVANVGLMEGVQFANDLLQNSRGKVTYRFQAKLDIGTLLPAIVVEKTGEYAL